MARAVIGDGVVSLPPLSSADAEAHLAGCERAIVDSLGGGEPITEDRVRQWLAEAATSGSGAARWSTSARTSPPKPGGELPTQRGLHHVEPGQVNPTDVLYPNWRARGHATRSVRLVVDLARRNPAEVNVRFRIGTSSGMLAPWTRGRRSARRTT